MPAWSVASSLLLCGIAAATAQPQGVNFGGSASSKAVASNDAIMLNAFQVFLFFAQIFHARYMI